MDPAPGSVKSSVLHKPIWLSTLALINGASSLSKHCSPNLKAFVPAARAPYRYSSTLAAVIALFKTLAASGCVCAGRWRACRAPLRTACGPLATRAVAASQGKRRSTMPSTASPTYPRPPHRHARNARIIGPDSDPASACPARRCPARNRQTRRTIRYAQRCRSPQPGRDSHRGGPRHDGAKIVVPAACAKRSSRRMQRPAATAQASRHRRPRPRHSRIEPYDPVNFVYFRSV